MSTEFLEIVNQLLMWISELFRFVGMAILGLGIGWLVVDLFKKIQVWQGQIALFLGLAGLIIAMTVFTSWGALGAFGIGVGVAILIWGMPKKQKEEKS
jgi:hypothetical protein